MDPPPPPRTPDDHMKSIIASVLLKSGYRGDALQEEVTRFLNAATAAKAAKAAKAAEHAGVVRGTDEFDHQLGRMLQAAQAAKGCDCGKKVFYMTHYGVPYEARHPDLQCRC